MMAMRAVAMFTVGCYRPLTVYRVIFCYLIMFHIYLYVTFVVCIRFYVTFFLHYFVITVDLIHIMQRPCTLKASLSHKWRYGSMSG